MSKLPFTTLRRASLPNSSPTPTTHTQIRHATLLKRPHRPYTFTQLVTLSDGSTYTQRTTSPQPIFKSTKDTRNHPMWQPTMSSLKNKEEDEAGRLRAFRNRFGRGWDAESAVEEEGEGDSGREQEDSLMDLISGNRSPRREVREESADLKREGEVEMVTVKKDGVLVKVPAQSRNERRGGKA